MASFAVLNNTLYTLFIQLQDMVSFPHKQPKISISCKTYLDFILKWNGIKEFFHLSTDPISEALFALLQMEKQI